MKLKCKRSNSRFSWLALPEKRGSADREWNGRRTAFSSSSDKKNRLAKASGRTLGFPRACPNSVKLYVGEIMKITGFLMMPAGWFLVLAALVLLRAYVAQSLFVAAGMGVEIMGLVLFTRSHLAPKRGHE